MADFRNGDHEAAAQLVELFYRELKRIEAARMRSERLDHTLQPTAVVHELYLELVKVKALRPANLDGVDEKAAFLGLAAFLMKRLLIHHARPLSRRAQKTELSDLPGPQRGNEYAHAIVGIMGGRGATGAKKLYERYVSLPDKISPRTRPSPASI